MEISSGTRFSRAALSVYRCLEGKYPSRNSFSRYSHTVCVGVGDTGFDDDTADTLRGRLLPRFPNKTASVIKISLVTLSPSPSPQSRTTCMLFQYKAVVVVTSVDCCCCCCEQVGLLFFFKHCRGCVDTGAARASRRIYPFLYLARRLTKQACAALGTYALCVPLLASGRGGRWVMVPKRSITEIFCKIF